eukprot:symbB.v1.2.017944.t1/scaffold1411.1/size120435/2
MLAPWNNFTPGRGDFFLGRYAPEEQEFIAARQSFKRTAGLNEDQRDLDAIIIRCLEVLEMENHLLRKDALSSLWYLTMGCMSLDVPVDDLVPVMRQNAAVLCLKVVLYSTYLKDPVVAVYTCLSLVYHDVAWTAISPSSRIGPSVNGKRWPRRCPWCASRTLEIMVKVTVGKAEDPWCEIELTEEDVEDWKKGVDITEEKFKEVIQLPPITLENCHEREDGDLQWDEITFEEEVNGKYWPGTRKGHAVIMALHRIREDFVKKQRKMKHLDWYMTMKKTSDKRNAKYYV